MAKSKTASDTISDMNRQALAAFRLNPVIGPHVHQFWQVQDKLLKEAEEFSKHWFARRHQATRSALKVSEEAIGEGASDPTTVMKAMNEWQAHSAERVAEDIQEWIDLCSRCAGHLASGEAVASRESIEKASEEIALVKKEHADPV